MLAKNGHHPHRKSSQPLMSCRLWRNIREEESNILRDKLCLSGSREPVARGFRCRAPLLESVSGDREVLGSSFYKLPKVLQWFSGNIGFHHIHHLSSRIPNYNLDRCHRSDPVFEEVVHLTLRESFKTLTYTVWEEKARRLISFRKLKHQGNEPSVAD